MDLENVDLELLRIIFVAICVLSVISHNTWVQYEILQDVKKVKREVTQLIFYITIILPYLIISSWIVEIKRLKAKILFWLEGKKEFCLLGGQNLLHLNDFQSQCELPTLFLMKFNGTSKEFVETMKLHVYNMLYHKLDQNQTICGSIETFREFHYIKRDKKINFDSNVREFTVEGRNIKSPVTKFQLLRYIAEKLKTPLNIKKAPLWTILIGTQSVQWNDNDSTKYYSVIFKFSHCLFDRASFMKLILGTFADIKDLNVLFPEAKEAKSGGIICRLLVSPFDYLNNIRKKIYCLYKCIPTVVVNNNLLQKKSNGLVMKSRNANIFLYAVDLGENFIEKVNKIKNKFPTVTEFSILEAVVGASLTQYCRRNKESNPVNIVCMSVENEGCLNLTEATPESLKFEDITYESNVGFTLLNICTPNKEDINVENILYENYLQRKSNKNITEAEITRELYNGNFYKFGNGFKKLLYSDKSISTLISNFPGPSSTISMNGISVEHIISWSPHLLGAGVSFAVTSYRGRYHLTVTINQSFIRNSNTADGILESINKFIEQLSAD